MQDHYDMSVMSAKILSLFQLNKVFGLVVKLHSQNVFLSKRKSNDSTPLELFWEKTKKLKSVTIFASSVKPFFFPIKLFSQEKAFQSFYIPLLPRREDFCQLELLLSSYVS